jgi:hypothetical protein
MLADAELVQADKSKTGAGWLAGTEHAFYQVQVDP